MLGAIAYRWNSFHKSPEGEQSKTFLVAVVVEEDDNGRRFTSKGSHFVGIDFLISPCTNAYTNIYVGSQWILVDDLG